MSWLQKLIPSKIRTEGSKKRSIPEGLWTKCSACDQILYRADLERRVTYKNSNAMMPSTIADAIRNSRYSAPAGSAKYSQSGITHETA